ncbi:MAG TPA: hypothetical protein VGH27_04045 [Streptosporangiaceae bacterium]
MPSPGQPVPERPELDQPGAVVVSAVGVDAGGAVAGGGLAGGGLAGAALRGAVLAGAVLPGLVPGWRVDREESTAESASWATDSRASPAPAICDVRPGPDSRIRRAARQIGHQAHSGGSPVCDGSVVATSQASTLLLFPPVTERNWPLISRPSVLALLRTSQRWISPTGSLPRELPPRAPLLFEPLLREAALRDPWEP